MSEPYSPPWTRGYAGSRRSGHSHLDLRVSDAERAEVADRLSRHYGDGRLDEAELNERLDQAMKAKRRSDLSGLFDDLPGADPVEAAEQEHYERRRHRVLFLLLVIAATVAVGHVLAQLFIPWVLIGLLAFLWWQHGPRHHHRS
jgi:hypothetical protein